MYILKDLDTKINNMSAQQEKAIALLSFKETIPKALVMGPHDKNIGRLDIYCPSILYDHMLENF